MCVSYLAQVSPASAQQLFVNDRREVDVQDDSIIYGKAKYLLSFSKQKKKQKTKTAVNGFHE